MKKELKYPELGDFYKSKEGAIVIIIKDRHNYYRWGCILSPTISLYEDKYKSLDNVYRALKFMNYSYVKKTKPLNKL